MGSVRYRADRGRYQLDYLDADGRRCRPFCAASTTRKQAEAQLREIEAGVRSGLAPVRGGITLGEVAAGWLRSGASRWAPSTLRNHGRALGDLTTLADRQIRYLTPAEVDAVLSTITGPGRRDCARRVLSAVCREAVRLGHMDRSPVASTGARRPRIPRYLTPTEYATILDGTSGEIRDAVVVSVRTGVRQGELVALMAEDVQGHSLVVQRAYDYHARRVRETKSHSARRIPMHPDVAEVLSRLPGSGYVWSGSREGRWGWWRDGWQATGRRLGLPAGTHVFRHTAASWWIQAGGSLVALQRILGHSSVTQTMVYAHLAPDTVDEEARRLWGHLGTLRDTYARTYAHGSSGQTGEYRK